MNVRSGFIDSIGNTPLIKLRAASEATGCDIYGKAEFLNPGGSVKDRAAKGIIADAEARGLLKPGYTIVEGTAGNTGIGLALVGAAENGFALHPSDKDGSCFFHAVAKAFAEMGCVAASSRILSCMSP